MNSYSRYRRSPTPRKASTMPNLYRLAYEALKARRRLSTEVKTAMTGIDAAYLTLCQGADSGR